jgi:integrase
MGRLNDYPKGMARDGRNGFFVTLPDRRKKRVGDETIARDTQQKINLLLESRRQREASETREATFGPLVDLWIAEELPNQPWSPGYRVNQLTKMRRIQRELGSMPIRDADSRFIKVHLLKFCKGGELFNKWLRVFDTLCAFAVETKQGQVTANEAANVVQRSESKKLEINRKVRSGLDVLGFKAIHTVAEPWLKLAMEISLLTLMARNEVLALKHEHFRNGQLYVIRKKVAADSDMGCVSIASTPELETLRSRALRLDDVFSAYLIHRRPVRRKRAQAPPNREDWARITGDYLTKAFLEARDACGVYTALPAEVRPTFHEIRGMGSRIAKAQGSDRGEIKDLMQHSNPRTTEIYLQGGAAALSDSDYYPVKTLFSLASILKGDA